jgi:hypothetical protein
MSGPVPTLGYRSISAAALALSEQGLRNSEIGRRLGIQKHMVGAMIATGKRSARRPPPERLTILLGLDSMQVLREEAQRRGATAEGLASLVLATVIKDNLFVAVLDDGDEP